MDCQSAGAAQSAACEWFTAQLETLWFLFLSTLLVFGVNDNQADGMRPTAQQIGRGGKVTSRISINDR